MGILDGVKIVEFEGLGPGPFCGMMLADHGADVIVVERAGGPDPGAAGLYRRGKRSIVLDLKNDGDRESAAAIAAGCDGLIEGLRPGVMERLGLGPDILRAQNPKLVYGRLTGWGQDGPLAKSAGHDINYISLSGAAWYSGAPDASPTPPPTLVGDIAGGALFLAFGLIAGILRARENGEGCVVDAAIVDGSAYMMSLLLSLRAAGQMPDARGDTMLDDAPFYRMYRTRDDQWISIGCLEPKFYTELLQRLGLNDDPDFDAQYDVKRWPVMREKLSIMFAAKNRADWDSLLSGTDACYAPVLSVGAASLDAHMAHRQAYRDNNGVIYAAAAPRFDGTPPPVPPPPPKRGAHTDEILAEFGLSEPAGDL